MKNTLLWEAISTLSKSERREWMRFVESPFFNRKKQLTGLALYLNDCMEQSVFPEEFAAFAAAYPHEAAFSGVKLRLALSDLLALTERFWSVSAYLSQEATYRLSLSALYHRRGLARHARIARREAQKAVVAHPFQDADHFHLRYEQEMEVYQAASVAGRYEDFNLQTISDLTDAGFAARKLRHTCLMMSHKAVVKKEYDMGLYPLLLAWLSTSPLLQEPAVGLYFHACHFLSDPAAEAHFQAFNGLLQAHANLFPQEEQRALFLLAINFGIKKSNETGLVRWYQDTLHLYQTALVRHLLFENGRLSRFAYNNMVGIAIRVPDATPWAEQFIQEYRPYLERKYREAAFSLNAARIAFIRKDYGSALLYLQKADYKDFIDSLNARTLQMKIYYEMRAFDLLESHLESMLHFIRRQNAAGYHRENFLHIIHLTRQLMRCNSGAEKIALAQEIEITRPLTEREWLLKMVEAHYPEIP